MATTIVNEAASAAWSAATSQQAQLEGLDALFPSGPTLRYYTSGGTHLRTVTHAAGSINTSASPRTWSPGALVADTPVAAGTAAYVIASTAPSGGTDILRADIAPMTIVTGSRPNLQPQTGAAGLVVWATSSLPLIDGAVPDDNLLNFNEGTSTTGWSVTSGSGDITQSGSSVRLASTSAAVTAALNISGPASNDFIILVSASAKYTSGQYSTLRFMDGATAMLELSFGYDHAAAAETLGTISVTDGSTGNVLSSGVNYETTPQKFAIHIDLDFGAVNVYAQHSGGGWLFQAAYAYAAGFASLDAVQMVTSADIGQWVEYDWLGYARPNLISIGDSINAGHNTFDPDPSVYPGEDNPDGQWQRWCVLYPTLRNTLIVNKGIGGQSSTEILARIAWVTAHSPRLLILHASTNDEVLSVSKATRSANIQACIDAAAVVGAECVLLNAMYGTSGNAINPDHRAYMASWWASDRLALTGLLAAIDIMVPVASGDYMAGALTETDGIHPTPAGYQAIGEYIATEMP